MELIDELARIQQELNAPKGQHNDFGNYNYRSCEDILTAVKPLLNGLVINLDDQLVQVGERYYIKSTVTLKSKDSFMQVTGYAREPLNKKGMDESQITGCASSYARKYALNGLFAIDDTKDADTNEHHNESGGKVDGWGDSKENDGWGGRSSWGDGEEPKWFNDFDKLKGQMQEKIKSGEQTVDGIIKSLKDNGFAVSKKTQDQIRSLS